MTRILTALVMTSMLSAGACKGQTVDTPEIPETPFVETAIAVTSNPVNYRFASLAEAGTILTTMDDHFGTMQKKEMGVRLMDPENPSLEKLSAQYRAAVMDFTDEEKAFIMASVDDSLGSLGPFRRYLPDDVLFAKISTDIEGGLPHTRGNLILFSKPVMDSILKRRETDPDQANYEMKKLFLHELHHVLTRANQDRMDDYFALIGYKPCDFKEPEELLLNRLTNPDATANNHYAPVTIDSTEGLIPYLRVRGPYDKDAGGLMGGYMDFGLLRVDVENGKCTATDAEPQFIGPVPDFMELIGQNTSYIIHPEETLADNFVHYVMQSKNLANPEIPEAVGKFWTNP